VIELKVEHFCCSIVVSPRLWNRNKNKFYTCSMIFDTGATMTALDTKIVNSLGYSLKNAKEVSVNGIGQSNILAKRLTLIDFELGGVELGPVLVDVLDFPEDSSISAVLGMNVVKH